MAFESIHTELISRKSRHIILDIFNLFTNEVSYSYKKKDITWLQHTIKMI